MTLEATTSQRVWRKLRALATLPALLVGVGSPALCQLVVSPSSHFGATLYPDPEPLSYIGLQFDRFTRYGKEVDSTGQFILRPYNALPTFGLNMLTVSASSYSRRFRSVVNRVSLQVGTTTNQPTKAAQDWIHENLFSPPLRPVPDAGELYPARLAVGGTIDVSAWNARGPFKNAPVFGGGGVTLSTAYQEQFAHVCVRSKAWRWWGLPGPSLSGIARAGLVQGGWVFPDSAIQRTYWTWQWSARVPLGQLLDEATDGWPTGWRAALLVLAPDLEYVRSRDAAFFRSVNGEPMAERFVSFRAEWYRGWVQAEYWNDLVSDKDQGPTGGLRIFVQAPTLPLANWLP